MKELLQIEYLKIKHYTIFKAFMLIFLVLIPILFYTVSLIEVPFLESGSDLFRFPAVWSFLPYISSWFVFLPSVLVISLVCNEISFKTQKQNVIDGLSKLQVILSKFYVVLVLSVLLTVYVLLVGLVYGAITSGFSNMFYGIEKMGFFFIQTFGALTIAMLLAVIIRKSALAIIAFLILFLLSGPLSWMSMSDDLSQFLPFNIHNSLVPNAWMAGFNNLQKLTDPTAVTSNAHELGVWVRTLLSVAYTGLFVFLSYFIMKKRDL